MQETVCPPTTSKAKLRFESVDFSDIPGQSKLFLQYQKDPVSLRKYYPSAIAAHTEVAQRVEEVLASYTVDRDTLCDVLDRQNRLFGAGQKTFENIASLRKSGAVAVVTGQQTGLFTGPLYTIYKAMSALRMVECLRTRGIAAVAVFWAATEDHDFDEIARAFLLDSSSEESVLELGHVAGQEQLAVGRIPIPDSFDISRLLEVLPETDFRNELYASLAEAWKPGETIGNAFCTQLQSLFREHGLIVVDPLDHKLKQLASPIYAAAIERANDIIPALVTRSRQLEAEGYQAQVLIEPDYFPLFYHTDDGRRRTIRRKSDDVYRIVDTDLQFTRDQLAKIAVDEPERFGPGVMLRPIVQDYLFPTICYFGGGAEIAYFAQNSEVYRLLDRPVTTILHRQSFSIVEAKHARTLEKYDLRLNDLFTGLESILPTIVERYVNPSTARLFADAEENIGVELLRLDEELSQIDPSLAENLATRRRKIMYHLEALRRKFHRVQLERDAIVNRQLRALFAALWPHGQLQERTLNVTTFTARYGPYFLDWLYDSIDLDELGHRVLYL